MALFSLTRPPFKVAYVIFLTFIILHLATREKQKNVVRVLFIVPFYAIFSFLSRSVSVRLYFETVRDIWEALVIYCFLVLILAYCGARTPASSRLPKSLAQFHILGLCTARCRKFALMLGFEIVQTVDNSVCLCKTNFCYHVYYS